jgi:glucose-1-phosphate thymidylyltransferase
MIRKGIILAGGLGTRLHPLTISVSKQLLPVYDKPMIYYPLSLFMLAGIRDILIITTPEHQDQFYRSLGTGKQWGLNFSYATQTAPEGIAQAFIIGESFLNHHHSALALGDNIFYSHHLSEMLKKAYHNPVGATLFLYPVDNPSMYGVVEFDAEGCPSHIIEKPKNPISNLAVTGLYFYDNQVVDIAKSITPSDRNELEITSINQHYLQNKQVDFVNLGRGAAWLDSGTHESLLEASQFVEIIEKRQGLKIACLEEIALHCRYITIDEFAMQAHRLRNNAYGQYLLKILREESVLNNAISA